MAGKAGSKDDKDIPQTIIEKCAKINGEITTHSYIKGKFLGKGGFARVYELLCSESNEVYACKYIPKEKISKSRARQKLMSEIKIHRSLSHTNIVRFHHFFEDDDFVYIILELCRNHSLSDVLRRRKRLAEIEAQSYLQNLSNALLHLHSHRIIHRDIKLANILLTDKMEVKLGDFGLAAKLEYEGERKRTICGTPNYIAPEILDGKNGHSYECDVWSFGVLMYTMLVGKPPFETNDVKTTYRRIKMTLYNFPDNIEISKEAKSLISSILIADYNQRPSLEEIVTHNFFTKNAIPKILPTSLLAIPPTSAYIKKFLTSRDRPTRASSQENKAEIQSPSPLRIRHSSKDSRRNSEGRKEVKTSSYAGNDIEGPVLWITHWIDYSKKYGVGYLFSNSCIGAVFNDSTKIISNPQFSQIQYISSGKNGEQISVYGISEFPQELYKKVMLLHLFKKQFMYDEKGAHECSDGLRAYLKKWLITPHAMIFRISNKVIQICFRDGTELLLSSESKHLTYVDKQKNMCSHHLSSALETGNKELIKRLKYSKEVLVKMLKNDDKD